MRDLPRVTEVLRGAGLVDTSFFTQEARDLGSALHLAAALSDEDDLDESTVDEAIRPELDAWRAFLRDSGAEVLAVEEHVVDELCGYQGTLDRRIKLNGREGVLDLKRGGSAPWHPIQLAAYAATFGRPLARWNLYLRQGRYQLVEHTDRNDSAIFYAALTIFNWRKSHGSLDHQAA